MKIGIDARMYGPTVGGGGLGRYVEQFITQLPTVDQENHFVLFVKNSTQADVFAKFKTISTSIHWYTLREQLFLGALMDREHLDLIHFPHWNVPMNLKTPFVITIHDLILIEQPESARQATTLQPWLYHIKYWGYKRVLRHALAHAKRIIAVSEYVKASILAFAPNTDPRKIHVVHEGVTTLPTPSQTPRTTQIPQHPYLLYVGNAYPHKNLPRLIEMFEQLAPEFPDLHLVLAGRKDIFFQKLDDLISTSSMRDRIVHISDPSDQHLSDLYAHATLFLFPSLSEGFGLPPLEAMSHGVPVVSSKAACLPEILGNAATYFDPTSIEDMTRVTRACLQNPEQQSLLRTQGYVQVTHYDWKRMTEKISQIYATCGTT